MAIVDIHHHTSSLDIVVVAYWQGKEGGQAGRLAAKHAENDPGQKKKRKNENNINGRRMNLLLCCKKGLVGMITGES